MTVENCKRCKKVFRKAHSPLCPECYQKEMEMFDKVYQYLGKTPQQSFVHLSDIAQHCGLPMKEVEEIFFSGKLGLAGNRIAFNCQICNCPINQMTADKKRLCPQCAITVEVEGKLHIQDEESPSQEKPKVNVPVLRSDKEYQEALEQKKAQVKETTTSSRRNDSDHQYGFKRLTHD